MIRSAVRARYGIVLILSAFSAFLLYWFGPLTTASSVFSVDLPGHVRLIDRTARALGHGSLFFFDRWWFSGWGVFDYYGFLPYLSGAVLSWLVQPLTRDPALLAAHISMLAGCAVLPWSFYYAALPLVRELWAGGDEGAASIERLTAVFCCVLAFWFLNQPGEWHGIGAGAVWHTGFYTQLFGWHAGLLFLGALYRTAICPALSTGAWFGVLLAILIFTHTLTAFFFLALALLAVLRFSGARGHLCGGIALGLLLSAPQWMPMAIYGGAYTWQYVFPPEGDLVQLLLSYPLGGIADTVRAWLRGEFVPLDLTYLLVAALLTAFIGVQAIARTRLLSSMGAMTAVLILLFSSSFVAASVPAGVHYYRLYAYLFLVVTHLCVAVPAAVIKSVSGGGARVLRLRVARSILLWCALASFLSSAMVSSLRGRTVSRARERAVYGEHMRVLRALGDSTLRGRVMFEYDRHPAPHSFISPQYLAARLGPLTGRETMNGLFIQSSLSAQFAAESFRKLGAEVYRAPPLVENIELDDQTALMQLRDFGIAELVLVNPETVGRIAALSGTSPRELGRFSVLPIGEQDRPIAEYPQREVLGYYDRLGSLPFKYVEYFFYTDAELYRRFEVIEILNPDMVPSEVKAVIAHGGWPAANEGRFELFGFGIPPREAIDPVEVRLSLAAEQDEYRRVFPALKKAVGDRIRARPPRDSTDAPEPPHAAVSSNGQSIEFSAVAIDRLVRINYSYLPHWRSDQGEVFRGTAERLFFLPREEQGSIRYERHGNAALRWAMILSIVTAGAVLAIFIGSFRSARPAVEESNGQS